MMTGTGDMMRRDGAVAGAGVSATAAGVAGRLLRWASAGLLSGMAVLITADVVGRSLLGTPVPGTYELISMMLAALVFVALPLATERNEHVVVDVVDHLLPRAIVRTMGALSSLLSAAVVAALAWAMWDQGMSQLAAGGFTNVLRLPLAPVAFLMAATCAVSAVILVVKAGQPQQGGI